MGSFKYIDHTADIAAEIQGISLEDLFFTAAGVWQHIVFGEVAGEAVRKATMEVSANSRELLLVDFLSELNYQFTVKSHVFKTIRQLRINMKDGKWWLTGEMEWARFIPEHQEVNVEIKAITFHQMNIVEEGGVFHTRIVFDI